MTPIKVLIAAFILVVLLRTWRRRGRGDLSGSEAGAWTVLWLLVLAATWYPSATDRMARLVGIGRGADLLILVSIIALFTLVSWLLARVERQERALTELVRDAALRSGESRIENRESRDRIDPIPYNSVIASASRGNPLTRQERHEDSPRSPE